MLYVHVGWPESKELKEHEDLNLCVPCKEPEHVGEYLVPKHVYNDIFGDTELDKEVKATEDLLFEFYGASSKDAEKCSTKEEGKRFIRSLNKFQDLMDRVRGEKEKIEENP